jgi:sec-independent protein translocase protein TatB
MNLGFSEMVFIFFLALIIFGPKKLPEIGRQIGKALNEFKRASNEFRSQIEAEISNIETESRREVLPPASPPAGAIAASSTAPVIEAETQAVSVPVSTVAKAPDA